MRVSPAEAALERQLMLRMLGIAQESYSELMIMNLPLIVG